MPEGARAPQREDIDKDFVVAVSGNMDECESQYEKIYSAAIWHDFVVVLRRRCSDTILS
jgi:hypothetical protein